MDANQQPAHMADSFDTEEILQAQAELRNITLGYLKPMALKCAIQLGIPDAIHRCGGAASLPDLLAAIPEIPKSKKPYLSRLMRFLTMSGIFAIDTTPSPTPTTGGVYSLTPVSRLLVDDAVNGSRRCPSLSPFVLGYINGYDVTAALRLSEWFKGGDQAAVEAEAPFRMVHGTDIWGVHARDAERSKVFNAGMVSDTQFAMAFLVAQCGELFEGISSLVDVAGGVGAAARAIAEAFPHVKCSVLDLPIVVDAAPADGVVEYIAGDMMKFIPPADALLLKYVLHDWNDEDCVKILTQCKKAIKPGGKVIIIDIVIGSPSQAMHDVQVTNDLLMMVVTSGKERDEQEWHKIFTDAGFSHYEIRPVLGFLSVTELFA